MKISELLEFARKNLHVENPAKEANILLSSYLGKSREWIFLHANDKIENYDEFLNWIKRRRDNEPLEYITGKVSFYSREFFIESGVLIPRPESELLVDVAYNNIKDMPNPRILEIGVGSGIISIVLALLHKNTKICATDINKKALKLAYKNAKHFGVSEQIEFYECSYADGVSGEFDMLVSNPPYISDDEKLENHVLKEPHNALFGGKFGYEMLENLVKLAKLRDIKLLCCEMGYDQRVVMEGILKANEAKEFSFYKDLSSLDRGFEARF